MSFIRKTSVRIPRILLVVVVVVILLLRLLQVGKFLINSLRLSTFNRQLGANKVPGEEEADKLGQNACVA